LNIITRGQCQKPSPLLLRYNSLLATNICSLLNLTSLEILHLGSNPLKELPEHTFKKLSQVSELYLENCELETLPSR